MTRIASRDSIIAQLSARLAEQGLLVRSAFNLAVDDPAQPEGLARPAATMLLIGNAGASMWPAFSQSSEYLDGLPDPLDRWSARFARQLAAEFDALALFPFGGPPYHPFLSWARRGEPGYASPLGLTLHPEYGLWHAYRFALAFTDTLNIDEWLDIKEWQVVGQIAAEAANPCLLCAKKNYAEKPCLTSCPVDAFTGSDYRVVDCARFLDQNPLHDCIQRGCRARRACPVGRSYHYDDLHAQFHMRQFVVNHIYKDSKQ
ncbi:hypothetical protein [Amphritea sp. HPY]|uniref:hypothetical protein n=1 Tax=Amphritea sp. HPY TaxID=3421652 RepID=UPI003D7E9D30